MSLTVQEEEAKKRKEEKEAKKEEKRKEQEEKRKIQEEKRQQKQEEKAYVHNVSLVLTFQGQGARRAEEGSDQSEADEHVHKFLQACKGATSAGV